jgi:hypothetical protein
MDGNQVIPENVSSLVIDVLSSPMQWSFDHGQYEPTGFPTAYSPLLDVGSGL